MKTQKNRINTVLLRKFTSKHYHGQTEKVRGIFRCNRSKSYSETKVWSGIISACVLFSLNCTIRGLYDTAIGICILTSGLALVTFASVYLKEKDCAETFELIAEELEEDERWFTTQFPGFKAIKAEAAKFESDSDAWKYCLDWATKEVILTARKVKSGDDASRVALKIQFVAAGMTFGKSFDRGLSGYDRFFNETAIENMRFFREELEGQAVAV